ncbi:unnamed protein product [Rhizoctonia solani]|uniref:Uncharacterized protein n=1 Tax=Rhizoctonia solani TaxID=456999 RepID=A0A8H2X5E2_9AGAM|nr:unnamed protein product [Rhizoctonia solani]
MDMGILLYICTPIVPLLRLVNTLLPGNFHWRGPFVRPTSSSFLNS